jgi:hypothetical protein
MVQYLVVYWEHYIFKFRHVFDPVIALLPVSIPGPVPGSVPGVVLVSIPGTLPGPVPGSVPGQLLGSVPGSLSLSGCISGHILDF